MNIRSTPINHKQIYNLRTHGDKLSRLAGPFPSLVSFLEEMHENCPPRILIQAESRNICYFLTVQEDHDET